MYLGEYEGHVFREENRIVVKSSYNKNWYVGLNKEEIFAESDDDNHTEYYIAGVPFAESWYSEGNALHVYPEFIELPIQIQGKLDDAQNTMLLLLDGVDPCRLCRIQNSCHHPASCPENHYRDFTWQ